MTFLPKLALSSLTTLCIATGSASGASILVTTGQTVTGNTHNLTLLANDISPNNDTTQLANFGSNLLVSFKDSAPNGDFYLEWNGQADGLGFDASEYSYLQIDIARITTNMVDSHWQLHFEDDDSTIGGPMDSGHNVLGGPVQANQFPPFSIVIDLVNGTSTGAQGWGSGTIDRFRLDPFNSIANAGESFEISAITFGSELTGGQLGPETVTAVPSPTAAGMMVVGMIGLASRRRRKAA